ncbi:MAG: DUF2793 domain-containing protein [Deltaproteobacteria bacterium]|nr:DUF2793 domain-containing protein [Deltaproteobacteria bacterium]
MAITEIKRDMVKNLTLTNDDIATAAGIELSKLEEAVIQADGGRDFTGDQSMGNNNLQLVKNALEDTDAPNWGQVKGWVLAQVSGLEWWDSVIARQATPPVGPNDKDAYLIIGLATGVWAGKEDQRAQWDAVAMQWNYQVPTTGTHVPVDNEVDGVYLYTGGSFTKQAWENTTVDEVTLTKTGTEISIKNLGVATGKIANDAVDKDKINANVAGLGIVQATGGELDVNVDGASLEIDTDIVRIKDNGVTTPKINNGAVETAKIADDAVDKTKINVDIAGLGIVQATGGELDVNVDGASLEIDTDIVRIKDNGVTTPKINNDAVDKTKINVDIAGLGIVQATGGELDVNVDGVTLEIDTDVVKVKGGSITPALIAALGAESFIFGTASDNIKGRFKVVSLVTEDFSGTNPNMTYALPTSPKSEALFFMFYSGSFMSPAKDFTRSDKDVTMNRALFEEQNIYFIYIEEAA